MKTCFIPKPNVHICQNIHGSTLNLPSCNLKILSDLHDFCVAIAYL